MKHFFTLALGAACLTTVRAQETHELHATGSDTFSPSAMTIVLGDHVHIVLDTPDHTFTQVDQATWTANGSAPLPGGYNMGQGTPMPGTDFTITPTGLGTIYYVCQQHIASMGMKGTIAVVSGAGMEEETMPDIGYFAPNPATDQVKLITNSSLPIMAIFYDMTGRQSMVTNLLGERDIALGELVPGQYVVELRDQDRVLLARQRLVVH